jgi:molybdopterin synthase catalytic subunit
MGDEKTFTPDDVYNDSILVKLTHLPLDSQSLIDFVKSEDAGAVIYFGGTTRNSMDGKQVTFLSYEAYIPLALKTMVRIAKQAKQKWNNRNKFVSKVAIVHRLGPVPITQESIIVVLSACHRQEGWECAQWILEQMKQCAEIWKNELYNDGSTKWRSNQEDDDGDNNNNNNTNNN